jgi:hypothetical protein
MIAPKIKRVEFVSASVPVLFEGGEPINVYGFTISGSFFSGESVIFQNATDSSTFFVVTPALGANLKNKLHYNIPFIADKGLLITSTGQPNSTSVTIMYSNSGI